MSNENNKLETDAPASEWIDLLACKNKCAVTDSDENHCPETPMAILMVNGKEELLCYRCFLNVSKGAYNKTKKQAS